MIKGALFDLDGTITDSNTYWDRAPEAFLMSLGIKAEPDLGQMVFSMTVPEAVVYMINKYSLSLSPGEVMEGLHESAERFYSREVELKPGITEVLRMLKEEGISLAVVTVTGRELAESALKRHDIADLFEHIVTTDDAGAGKQEPAVYIMAADKLGSLREETLVFEDAPHAAMTAKKAGFITVGVYDDAVRDRQEELKKTTDLYLPDYRELSGLTELLKR